MRKTLILALSIISLFASGAFATIHPLAHTACTGAPITLVDSTSSGLSVGGTWSSSNTSVGTVNPTTGLFTGISAGTTTIVYSGTTTSSAIFTVYPTPAAITGGDTTLCVGNVTVVSDATSGGTWSSVFPSVATVTAGGIVTCTGAGITTIKYTLPGGCYATTSVTVEGTPYDSVIGPSIVCVGSTASFSAVMSGGTWASSNPAVATVSSTGVVTGISSGTAIISHSAYGYCFPGLGTKVITVTSTTVPGTISGPSTVATGSSISLSTSVSGGTFSSSSTSIATVSSTGVVTGVATGTPIITYTISGCSGPASITHTVTVTVPNCISGDVLFSGAPYTDSVKVWLIKYNPSTLMLTAVDSVTFYATGSSAHYSFCGMGTDSFRVKAACLLPTSGTGYLPTYHTSSAFWHSATVIYHVSGTHDMGKNIAMGYGTVTAGPGFIGGNVTTGANKGTAGAPAVGLLMYCVKSTGEILQKTYTDASGNYSFSSLPTDVAMTVHPELINYATTEFPTFTLTTAAPGKTAANFIQRTISMKIEPLATSVDNIASAAAAINVFPNPASGTLNIQWNTANAGTGTITIADVTGRQVLKTTVDMSNASGTAPINISGISNGIYMMNIKANGVNYNAKVEVK